MGTTSYVLQRPSSSLYIGASPSLLYIGELVLLRKKCVCVISLFSFSTKVSYGNSSAWRRWRSCYSQSFSKVDVRGEMWKTVCEKSLYSPNIGGRECVISLCSTMMSYSISSAWRRWRSCYSQSFSKVDVRGEMWKTVCEKSLYSPNIGGRECVYQVFNPVCVQCSCDACLSVMRV
jgi:hypothetical protein